MKNPPIIVQFLALFIPVLKWDDESNLSKGEIKKFNFTENNKNRFGFNKQVLSFEGNYDWIWRHVYNDWFKCIGKSVSRTC